MNKLNKPFLLKNVSSFIGFGAKLLLIITFFCGCRSVGDDRGSSSRSSFNKAIENLKEIVALENNKDLLTAEEIKKLFDSDDDIGRSKYYYLYTYSKNIYNLQDYVSLKGIHDMNKVVGMDISGCHDGIFIYYEKPTDKIWIFTCRTGRIEKRVEVIQKLPLS